MGQLIEITQYGVAKIDRKNEPQGLSTKDLNTCVAIIAINQNKMLMIHVDTNVHTDSIAKELAWIDTPYKLIIACNKAAQKLYPMMQHKEYSVIGFLDRLKNSCTKMSISLWESLNDIDAPNGYIHVNSNGTVCLQPQKTDEPKHAGLRQAINFMNYLSLCDDSKDFYAKMDLDVQFQNGAWTDMPLLNNIAKILVNTYKISKNWQKFTTALDSITEIPKALTRLLRNNQLLFQGNFSGYSLYNDMFNNETLSDNALTTSTIDFFKQKSQTSQWKQYPENKLTGQYVGHKVKFFTFRSEKDEKDAHSFTMHLKNRGFHAELKHANNKPSVVVDVTRSYTK